ncbi:hypothetical protein D3C87_2044350 [compost metagenome]
MYCAPTSDSSHGWASPSTNDVASCASCVRDAWRNSITVNWSLARRDTMPCPASKVLMRAAASVSSASPTRWP